MHEGARYFVIQSRVYVQVDVDVSYQESRFDNAEEINS